MIGNYIILIIFAILCQAFYENIKLRRICNDKIYTAISYFPADGCQCMYHFVLFFIFITESLYIN